MIAGVVGYGPVGKATAELMRRLGHEVAVGDKSPSQLEEARSEGYRPLDEDPNVDVLFICVPEANVLDALSSTSHGSVTVIRSTVPPGTTDDLSERFGRQLAHMPAFLRQATALWDTLNPPFLLVGCRNRDNSQYLAELLAPLLVPIQLVSPLTSEMVKLVLNAYLHTLISFWNEIHLLSNLVGVESHVIGKLCAQDPRVSAYGATLHGRPAGGRCLPKDLVQLITFAEDNGHEPNLLKAAQRVNHSLEDTGLLPIQE